MPELFWREKLLKFIIKQYFPHFCSRFPVCVGIKFFEPKMDSNDRWSRGLSFFRKWIYGMFLPQKSSIFFDLVISFFNAKTKVVVACTIVFTWLLLSLYNTERGYCKIKSFNNDSMICWKMPGSSLILYDSLLKLYRPFSVIRVKFFVHYLSTGKCRYVSNTVLNKFCHQQIL